MLILLPPSEGKFAPRRGKSLHLPDLNFPELLEAREEVLTALVGLCSEHDGNEPLRDESAIDHAAKVLGLTANQHDQIGLNARLRNSPAARADRIYTGVLYDALGAGSLSGAAKRRASNWLATTSSLFGLVRPQDHIPAYRLAGDVTLPGLGKVAAHWRRHLDPAVRKAAGNGLVIDLRSSTYASFWKPPADLAAKVATVRVLQQVGTERKVVSHFNKATKGRLVRAMLEDGSAPRSPAALAGHLETSGWHVELHAPGRTGTQLDVIVSDL